jgi:hypothetical protein
MIYPPIARKPVFVNAALKRLIKTSIAGLSSIFGRFSGSRKFQIEFASGTLWASDNPKKRMNERAEERSVQGRPAVLRSRADVQGPDPAVELFAIGQKI